MDSKESLPQASHLEHVIPSEEATVPLAKHVHGDCQRANANLYACNGYEHRSYAGINKPIIARPSQPERKDVLEDEEACKCLDGDVACGASRQICSTGRRDE